MSATSNRQLVKAVAFCVLFLSSSLVAAYDLAIMPVRPKALTEKLYQPLADYLAKATGKPIKLKAYNNFVNYWQDMRDGKFQLALDAAHFVDYRVKQQQHQVLVKLRDQVSFSLVSTENESILEPSELIGKPIACLPPPSRGNLEIDNFFKNPIRQPRKVEVKSYEDGVELLRNGKVKAAMLPTPMLNAYPNLMVIAGTELWPHMAVTASPEIPTEVKSGIARALLGMSKDKLGTAILESSGLNQGFEPADHSQYDGFSTALKSYGRYNR
jgi:phosphonate transport system substrate-binding protein